ncbi:hypothetical protein ACUN7V_11590 [Quadrisphaera oryzae]|uniref:hypothetical protein n=1 Tax=Quadrisphaera TaxID=317661 RepID=UPI0016470CDA|nr:hypothetical protein [Quadrisphaera sp. RL12-1S]MBC3764148.1 hypothetical protein [Quadrisphaera sp. RL12-1S]
MEPASLEVLVLLNRLQPRRTTIKAKLFALAGTGAALIALLSGFTVVTLDP